MGVRLKIFFLTLLAASLLPCFGQLYSYRNAEGRLVITDKPIKDDGFKLKDVYVPPRLKAKKAPSYPRTGSKYQLSKRQLEGLVFPIASSMNVDPELVKAVILVESSGDAKAQSHKGAMGLMQLIPDTAKRFGVENPWDPRQNIRGGISYLRWLLGYFEGNVDLVLAAYNAGENAVDRHGGIPPYKETIRYVQKVRRYYDDKSHPYDPRIKHRSKLLKGKKTTGNTKRAALAKSTTATTTPN